MQVVNTTMNVPFVDLKAQYQSIKPEVDAAIAAVLDETAFVGGPRVKAFEDAFAQYCGVGHCLGLANGTDALFIALKALGIGAGDEVITVANTFVATSEAIKMAGAQVVFVDINPTPTTLTSTKSAKITAKTRRSFRCISTGSPRTWRRRIGQKHGLRVIAMRRRRTVRPIAGSRLRSWPISPVSASIPARTSAPTVMPAPW